VEWRGRKEEEERWVSEYEHRYSAMEEEHWGYG